MADDDVEKVTNEYNTTCGTRTTGQLLADNIEKITDNCAAERLLKGVIILREAAYSQK